MNFEFTAISDLLRGPGNRNAIAARRHHHGVSIRAALEKTDVAIMRQNFWPKLQVRRRLEDRHFGRAHDDGIAFVHFDNNGNVARASGLHRREWQTKRRRYLACHRRSSRAVFGCIAGLRQAFIQADISILPSFGLASVPATDRHLRGSFCRSGRLLQLPHSLLKACNVVLAHNVRIARRDAALGGRIRIMGTCDAVLVKYRVCGQIRRLARRHH